MKKKFIVPKPIYEKKSQRAVLLLHAYSGSPNDVRMLARFLEQANYSVYTPMFRGHGTTNPEDILSQHPNDWWEDAQQAIHFLKSEDFAEIAVFGLSMGGVFATKLLELQDESIIGGGSFCSPIAPRKNQVPKNFYRYSEYVLATFSDKSEQEQQAILQRVPQLVEQQLTQIQANSQQVYLNLPTINVPIFVAQAAKDEMIPADSAFETVKALAKQKVTFQWYPQSGHVITIGPERKYFEQDVLSFIESLPWSEGKNE